MAYSASQRQAIKRWMGYGPLFNPELDAAITNTEGIEAETEVKLWLVELDNIRTRMAALRSQAQVAGAGNGEATLDTIRGIASLAIEGRMYVGFIADACDFRPLRDVFTPSRLSTYRL